jgi:hypothetical protein
VIPAIKEEERRADAGRPPAKTYAVVHRPSDSERNGSGFVDGSTSVTGPAAVVVVPADPSPLPSPTTTAPAIPGWYVHTYG